MDVRCTHRCLAFQTFVCVCMTNERDSLVKERKKRVQERKQHNHLSIELCAGTWTNMLCHAFQIECVLYIYTNAACKIRLAHRIVCCCCCCSIAIKQNRYTSKSIDIDSVELIELFYGIAVYIFDVKSSYFIRREWVRFHLLLDVFQSWFVLIQNFRLKCLQHASMNMKYVFPWFSQFIYTQIHIKCVHSHTKEQYQDDKVYFTTLFSVHHPFSLRLIRDHYNFDELTTYMCLCIHLD